MARYIDADLIPYVTSENGVLEDYAYRYDINEIPTADIVEVVRCKDCKYAKEIEWYGCTCQNTKTPWYNDEFEVHMNHDDFCSYGERKG